MTRNILLCVLISALLLAGQQPVVRGNGGSAVTQLGKLVSADMNVTTDQAITITIPGGATKYQVTGILFTNCSANIGGGTAAGTIYSAASKGGTVIYGSVATTYTTLSAATTTYQPAITITITLTGNVFLSLTTSNGSVGTCDVYVFGMPLQ